MEELKDKWALVTGASSGIGADLARLLAAAGCHLVLTARRKDRLDALKEELSTAHSIQVETISNDLSKAEGPKALYDQIEAKEIPISVLVNNAGIGLKGDFVDVDLEAQMALLQLNVTSVAELTHRFVPAMKARGQGWVLQVASLYAFSHGTGFGTYAASKHFLLNLSDSLNHELARSGVKVTALCPGLTRTEFFSAAGLNDQGKKFKSMAMSSKSVAKIGLDALLEGKPYVVPGRQNRFVAWSSRFTSRAMKIKGARYLQSLV